LAKLDFSIAIQHTPDDGDRRRWLKSILEKLRAEQPTVAVEVIKDQKRDGCWPTLLRCLEAAHGASHHLVLQDDITLCQDFLAAVREVIRARPNQLISLYTNSRCVFAARQRGESWIEKLGVAGPAIIWPTKLIGEFIEWQRAHIASDFPWDDGRVSMWLSKTSKPAFATVPSLAEHLGYQASLLGLNARSKVAAWYIGDNRSALGIDWSRGLKLPVRDYKRPEPGWWQYFHE
jgi:hypothetical protein